MGVLAGLLISAHAKAESRAPAPASASPPIPVTFRTTEAGAALSIRGAGIATNAGWCPSACTLNVSPGNYMVFLSTGGRKSASFSVDVRERSEVVVSPGSRFLHGLGLGLIIGGGAAFMAGALTWYSDTRLKNDPTVSYSSPDWVVPVEIAGAVGLGVAVAGLVVFLTTPPSVEVVPRRAGTERQRTFASQPSRFVFTPALGPNGGGFVAGWVF